MIVGSASSSKSKLYKFFTEFFEQNCMPLPFPKKMFSWNSYHPGLFNVKKVSIFNFFFFVLSWLCLLLVHLNVPSYNTMHWHMILRQNWANCFEVGYSLYIYKQRYSSVYVRCCLLSYTDTCIVHIIQTRISISKDSF